MELTIKNCNNIDDGKIEIEEGRLNIKYAFNGTGKSTIAKSIEAFVANDEELKKSLLPFKYYKNAEENLPRLNGFEKYKKVAIFNEKYVSNYVFQQNELIKNSFEIFVKSPDYDKHLNEIEKLLENIRITFRKHPELEELINNFQQFIDGFGKSKSGYSSASAIGKGIGKGNKIDNIPSELSLFEPYLKSSDNVKWIKWHLEGNHYLNVSDQCPYCCGTICENKEIILNLNNEYDSKSVEQLSKMLDVFDKLTPYFSEDTASKITLISKNISGITDEQKNYLIEIKKQVENLMTHLNKLKQIGFHSLKNKEKISNEIEKYKIDISYYSHLNSELTNNKVELINQTLDVVLEKAGKLQGEIAQQKKLIQKTIETYSKEINDFLYYAGYKYRVSIEDGDDEENYRLTLKHNDSANNIQSVNDHLSYGERNAFALVLFMYSVLKEDADFIVLDDPISSFDGNKKFAIINMLFMGGRSLKERTVLLLTHDFNTVIDAIYNFPSHFQPAPIGAFITTKNGLMEEKKINKKDIKSFGEIARMNIKSNIDTLNKLIYLRRLKEIENKDGVEWQLLSNIFHKRKNPEYHFSNGDQPRVMTDKEIKEATEKIRKYIDDFDYDNEYLKTQDLSVMEKLYKNSKSNYEKLQIYRIIFNENNRNSVIKKFVNETFHIENDYLFQLNPCEYDTVPQYIIDECDKDIGQSF